MLTLILQRRLMNMEKNIRKMNLASVDDIFSTQEERDNANLEKIVNISLNEIDDFPEHPFKVGNNEEMQDMAESIKTNGVLVPAIVRKKEDGRYEMISGHRRKFASRLAGIETLPCVVRDYTDDEATIMMVDSNKQREKILPSEKAFAYKMKMNALSHQGKKTLRPLGDKLKTADEIGKENEDSGRQVQRYIRLTELIPKLLEMVDNEKIAFRPAVELSYLKKDEQEDLLNIIEYNDITPSLSQAIKLKQLSLAEKMTVDDMEDLMSEDKPNATPKLRVSMNKLNDMLPKELKNDRQREDYVIKAVEFYVRYQQKQKERLSQER